MQKLNLNVILTLITLGPDNKKSRSGFAILINDCIISWASRKQGCVALSTGEAEYIAASDACREIKWLRLLLAELEFSTAKPTTLCIDNKAAEAWANHERSLRRAKHIEVRHHFVRSCVHDKSVVLDHVKFIFKYRRRVY
eukprot:IDg5270t1